jgi:hypothetical protein
MVAIDHGDLGAVSLDIDDPSAVGRFATGDRVPISCNGCSLPDPVVANRTGKREAFLVSDHGHVGVFRASLTGLSLSLHFAGPKAELIGDAVPVTRIDFTGLLKNRRQSTVSSGKIEFEDIEKSIDLKSGDVLTLGSSTDLSITSLTVIAGRLQLVLFGTVDELRTGRAKFTEDRLPSYLQWLHSRTPLLLYGSTVLFFGGLLLGAARELKLISKKGKA